MIATETINGPEVFTVCQELDYDAVSMRLIPARGGERGGIMMKAARRLEFGIPPRFDWERAICARLDFCGLCQVLAVLRGLDERVDVYDRKDDVVRVSLRHDFPEPNLGMNYTLSFCRLSHDGTGGTSARILLAEADAMGLGEAIAGSMSAVCFGSPSAA